MKLREKSGVSAVAVAGGRQGPGGGSLDLAAAAPACHAQRAGGEERLLLDEVRSPLRAGIAFLQRLLGPGGDRRAS